MIAAVLRSLCQLGLVVGSGLALLQQQALTTDLLLSLFGWRAVLATSWIGSPVHELAHVLSAVCFRFRIEQVTIYSRGEEDGVLGSVQMGRIDTWWSRLGVGVVGIAPLAGGAATLVGLLYLVPVPALDSLGASRPPSPDQALALMQQVATSYWSSWRLWVFVFLAFAVASHTVPSQQDLQGPKSGMAVLALFPFAANAAAALGIVGAPATALTRVIAAFVVVTVVALVLLGGVALLCTAWLSLSPRSRRLPRNGGWWCSPTARVASVLGCAGAVVILSDLERGAGLTRIASALAQIAARGGVNGRE